MRTHVISDHGVQMNITTTQKLRLQKKKLIYYCSQCKLWHLENQVSLEQVNKAKD